MIYNITPCPKPRMTSRDKWKKRPPVLRYRAFADECRLRGVKIENGCSIVFRIPMPSSWSNKKRLLMDKTPHTVRPDIDNLLKSVMDAVLPEDSHIYELGKLRKEWSEKGQIEIISL